MFREQAGVTGLIMTKLDGTARGGILVAIAARFCFRCIRSASAKVWTICNRSIRENLRALSR